MARVPYSKRDKRHGESGDFVMCVPHGPKINDLNI